MFGFRQQGRAGVRAFSTWSKPRRRRCLITIIICITILLFIIIVIVIIIKYHLYTLVKVGYR